MAPLLYKGALPTGALVQKTGGLPFDAVTDPFASPLWFTAAPDRLHHGAGGGVIGWSAQPDRPEQATPVSFNEAGTGFDPALGALCFTEDSHAGLIIAEALPKGEPFSFALIFRSTAKEIRTLVTLQTRGTEDYIFVSGEDRSLRAASRSGADACMLPDPGGVILLLCTIGDGVVQLSVNDAAAVAGRSPALPGPVDLFLGCRSGSRSLRNKIGCFDLFDLMVWPDLNVLADPMARAPHVARTAWLQRRAHAV